MFINGPIYKQLFQVYKLVPKKSGHAQKLQTYSKQQAGLEPHKVELICWIPICGEFVLKAR